MQRSRWMVGMALALLLGVGTIGAVLALNLRGEVPLEPRPVAEPTPTQVERGAYLARVGNCMGCHTAQGAAAYAGGRGIETPFGVVYSSNLTPDPETGLGRWTPGEFWRAMHHGRSRDGRLLYPAFPYPNYTYVTREDSDALWAYLQSLPAVAQENRSHALRFPYNTQAALAVWRALFFSPGTADGSVPTPQQAAPPASAQRPDWRRGAYLVEGLGHCSACHTPRNAWGATRDSQALTGGLIPVQNWYAPSLIHPAEGAVGQWSEEEVIDLLRTGVSTQGSVLGPMAEVVFRSTQYLSDTDARAMAIYLRSLTSGTADAVTAVPPPPVAVMDLGGKVYEAHCSQCHGPQGQGEPGAFAPLAGRRAVHLSDPTNLVRVVLQGGYLPATAGHPRPHGMPPFQQVLSDQEVAAVTTYIRNSWGNAAGGVGTMEVYRARERRGLQP